MPEVIKVALGSKLLVWQDQIDSPFHEYDFHVIVATLQMKTMGILQGGRKLIQTIKGMWNPQLRTYVASDTTGTGSYLLLVVVVVVPS